MSAAVAAARIGDLGQEGKQTTPERCVHAAPPCCSSAKSGLSPPRVILLSSQRQTVNGRANLCPVASRTTLAKLTESPHRATISLGGFPSAQRNPGHARRVDPSRTDD